MQKNAEIQTAYRGVPVLVLILVQTLEKGISLSREKAKTVRPSACYLLSATGPTIPQKQSYHGCEANKLQDYETANGVEDTTRLAETVVEELSHWLINWTGKDFGGVTHAEAEHDVEQEAGNVCEEHSTGDSPWCLDFRLRYFLGDMSSGIVIRHDP